MKLKIKYKKNLMFYKNNYKNQLKKLKMMQINKNKD